MNTEVGILLLAGMGAACGAVASIANLIQVWMTMERKKKRDDSHLQT